MWWTTGFAWDGDKIKETLTDWTSLWDERFKGHMAMLDDVREVFAVAAFRLGLSPNTTSDDRPRRDAPAPRAAEAAPAQVHRRRHRRPDERPALDHPRLVGRLGPDADRQAEHVSTSCPSRARSAARTRWSSCPARRTRSRPTCGSTSTSTRKVSAGNTNYIDYMGPNAAALQLIDPAISGDPRINPAKATLDRLVELLELGPDLDKYTQRWNALKA